ncbi:MAG: hypothetical protein WCL16_06200 [bacterium]
MNQQLQGKRKTSVRSTMVPSTTERPSGGTARALPFTVDDAISYLALRQFILADNWERFGCHDYLEFVAKHEIPDRLARQGMSLALQTKYFSKAARELYGRERINQFDEVVSCELEQLTLSQLIRRVADIFGVAENQPVRVGEPYSTASGAREPSSVI